MTLSIVLYADSGRFRWEVNRTDPFDRWEGREVLDHGQSYRFEKALEAAGKSFGAFNEKAGRRGHGAGNGGSLK